MPNVLNEFTGDGVTQTFNFSMTGGYLSRDYVYFFTRPNDDLLNYTPYNDDDVTWLTDFSVRTTNPIPVGTTFVILRSTTLDPLVDFQNTSRITEKNLDTATWQAVHIAAETSDTVGRIQVVATDAKRESATAATLAQEAADDAAASADSAQQAGAAAASALVASQVAQQEAISAALSADQAVTTAAQAESTAIAANATAQAANASAATATTTANTATTAATNATTTANNAVSVANSANATANAANASAAAAVVTANSAAASAAAAVVTANEAKDLVDQAVAGAVVSFNGRAGIVTPQAGDYTKAQVGLGNVDNTADVDKPVSTAQSNAIGIKADKSYVDSQLNTKADKDLTNAALAQKADQSYVTSALTANATDDRNRANHTGTQTIATVTGLQSALDSKLPLTGGALTGNMTVPSLNGGQIAGMRNRIINGNFRVWQRGTSGFTIPGTATYTADRWFVLAAGANITAERVDYNAGNASALVITGAASNTICDVGQRIEGANTEDLAGKVVTLSCEVYRTDTGIVTWEARYANAVDNFTTTTLISSGTIAVTGGTFKFAAVNFTVPLAFAHHGIEIRFKYGALAATKQASLRRVQLEVGEVATPFEHRPYGVELALCKRYYESLTNGLLYAGFIQVGGVNFQRTNFVKFEATKRAPPSCKIVDYWTGAVVTTLRNGGGNNSADNSIPAVVVSGVDGLTGSCQAVTPTAVSIIYNNFIADAEL